jgi:signal transduction histidine kinase
LVDLAEVCHQAVEAHRPNALAKSIALEVDTPADNLTVRGDTERLQQVLRHLLDNAVKFTPPGGSIVVRVERAVDRARLIVRDTGIGIHQDSLRRVFDRFWQEDGSATRRAGGLGLGLTLVRELVRLHAGSVSVESRGENAGTTITVDLPLAEPGGRADGVLHGGAGHAASRVGVD